MLYYDLKLKNNHRSIIVILLVCLVIYSTNFSPDTAFACSCSVRPNPIDALKSSTSVFAGKVIEIKSNESNIVKFAVNTTWKGVSASYMEVLTPSNDANCGYQFEMNKTYLVYATDRDMWGNLQNSLYTTSCSRDALFANSYDDLQILGTGTTPIPEFPLAIPVLLIGIVSLVVFYRIKNHV